MIKVGVKLSRIRTVCVCVCLHTVNEVNLFKHRLTFDPYDSLSTDFLFRFTNCF